MGGRGLDSMAYRVIVREGGREEGRDLLLGGLAPRLSVAELGCRDELEDRIPGLNGQDRAPLELVQLLLPGVTDGMDNVVAVGFLAATLQPQHLDIVRL